MELRVWQRRALIVFVVGMTTVAALYLTKWNHVPKYQPFQHHEVIKVHIQTPSEAMDVIKDTETIGENTIEQKQHILEDAPLKDLEEKVYSLMMTATYQCKKIKRMGNDNDGGWDICLDKEFGPSKGCLVYSFGIANDWSFDEAMAGEECKCEVHSFDPSIKKNDHKHSERVWFHNLGVADQDRDKDPVYNSWKMRTVKTLRKELGHHERIMDVLKMDVESAEWAAIPDMIAKEQFKNIKQFCFELHHNVKTNRQIFLRIYKLLMSLYRIGFEMFQAHANPACAYTSSISGKRYSWCNELYFVNMKYKV